MFKKNTLLGKISLHPNGYGFVTPLSSSGEDVFIPPDSIDQSQVLPGDEVLISVFRSGDGRFEGKILKIIKRTKKEWVGLLEKRGKNYFVSSREIGERREFFVIPTKERHLLEPGKLVIIKLEEGKGLKGKIVRVLGDPFEEKVQVESILTKYHLDKKFPVEVQKEADRLHEFGKAHFHSSRIDLTSKAFITIDGLNARDFDDAVFVEKRGSCYHLYVAIADVAHYVKKGSVIDSEALARGTSVYFPDFVIPMLPERLSNFLCSLRPDEMKPVLVSEIKYDLKGRMIESWFYEAVIQSKKRTTYEEIQSFYDSSAEFGVNDLQTKNYTQDILKSFEAMHTLARVLLKNKKERGALDFDLPEAEVVYNQKGEVIGLTKRKRFFAHQLIEEFMIAANVAVATLFAKHDWPLLYRLHENPEPSKMEDFFRMTAILPKRPSAHQLANPKNLSIFLDSLARHPQKDLFHYLLLRSLKQAHYSPLVKGHFGLNLENYCHFTSPIRRYPDLIVHRQLKTLLSKYKLHLVFENRVVKKTFPPKTKDWYLTEELERIGKTSSEKERNAMLAEREMLDLKRILFMQNHLDETFIATLKRFTKNGLFLELEGNYVEGFLPLKELKDDYYTYDEQSMCLRGRRKKHVYKMGDTFKVVVSDISWERKLVMLSLL